MKTKVVGKNRLQQAGLLGLKNGIVERRYV